MNTPLHRCIFTAALACAALALSGCWGASRYTVATTPPGAAVYLDDEYVGQSPCELRSRLGLWRIFNSPDVRIEKPGYKTVEYTKTARFDSAEKVVFGTVLALFPYPVLGVFLFPCGNGNGWGDKGLSLWCDYMNDNITLIPSD